MADAKIDAFLQLTMNGTPINGESTDDAFKDAIELLDCELKFTTESKQKKRVVQASLDSSSGLSGNTVSPTSGGSTSYESKVFELSIKKSLDISSPYLFMLFCKRKVKDPPVLNATVSVRKTGGGSRVFYELSLSDMMLVDYDVKWESRYMTEDVTFTAKCCSVEYSPQLQDGTLGTPQRVTEEFTIPDDDEEES